MRTIFHPLSLRTSLKIVSIISLFLLIISCQEKPSLSLSDKYETITEFHSTIDLASEIDESSGLIYENDRLWTNNDGGDAPNIYQINKESGAIISILKINEANNNDWEDMAEDSSYFYIADIGNNRGNRQDLNILKVLKPTTSTDTSYAASQINYSYADQNSFLFANEMHDFNAEALISVGDSLFIFTKNHISQDTRCYSIPKNPDNYEILPSCHFDTEGLITAADFDAENKVLVLLGYNNYTLGHAPFIWCFWDFTGNDFFEGKSKRFNLDFSEQAEGITFTQPGVVLISTEKEAGNGGHIWQLDLKQNLTDLW